MTSVWLRSHQFKVHLHVEVTNNAVLIGHIEHVDFHNILALRSLLKLIHQDVYLSDDDLLFLDLVSIPDYHQESTTCNSLHAVDRCEDSWDLRSFFRPDELTVVILRKLLRQFLSPRLFSEEVTEEADLEAHCEVVRPCLLKLRQGSSDAPINW